MNKRQMLDMLIELIDDDKSIVEQLLRARGIAFGYNTVGVNEEEMVVVRKFEPEKRVVLRFSGRELEWLD